MASKADSRAAAVILRRLAEAARRGELAASAGVVARLEGAATALEQAARRPRRPYSRRSKRPGQEA